MRVVVGPVLHFRGQDGDRWRLAALVVGKGKGEPGALRTGDGATVAPGLLAVRRGHAFWRYECQSSGSRSAATDRALNGSAP